MMQCMQTSVRDQSQSGSTELEPATIGEAAPAPVARGSVPVLLIKAMRPKQWSKNVLLFAGLLLFMAGIIQSPIRREN